MNKSKQSMTKEQITNAKKQAWTAFANNGYKLNSTVLYWAGTLSSSDKAALMSELQSPPKEE